MNSDQERIIELVRQTQSGDQAAFSALYDEFAQRIYAFIRIKVSGNVEQAEDILQDVFLKAWKGCKSLDLKDLNFSAWLYKVATNTINDYYRKIYREPKAVSIDEARDIAGEDDPAANASRGLEKYIVRETVDKLPPHFKEVIELRFFQDFSVAETARILGRESITVRVWQHRAVKQLQKLYKEQLVSVPSNNI
ncbi:sigma-70 family RNA polymerase sigma factor [bacterium]|nr:MAG: sigma-70 family RNA polymerase sigma factor [bacterium]